MSTVSREEIEKRVRDTLVEVLQVDPSKVTAESQIREDLGADSLDTATLLMALEEEFDQDITDDEAESLTTVGATVDFVAQKLASGD